MLTYDKNFLPKVGIEGTYLNIINAIYDKLIATIILSSIHLKKFSKIGNKIRMSTLAISIQHSIKSPNHVNKRRKRNKRNSH